MLRAGLIRRLGSGIYTLMPLGLRVVRKVETIGTVMNRAGAIELAMPVVQPAELWQESGRWQAYGPELLRLKDRHERDFVIQPTSEEVVTDIARSEIKSYRQLPVHFYQVQTKFRDERRPRFGVMRGREFMMKDGYSFHSSHADLDRDTRICTTPTRGYSRVSGCDFAPSRPIQDRLAGPALTSFMSSPIQAKMRSPFPRPPTMRPTLSSRKQCHRHRNERHRGNAQKSGDSR